MHCCTQAFTSTSGLVMGSIKFASIDDDYNLFKEKLVARIPKISIPLGNIPLAHVG